MKISFPVCKSLIALSLGTLGVCMSEFSIMGILPDVANNLNVSIPEAGHFISAYALGVCIGAPLTVILAGSQPLKRLLIGLMVLFFLGNLFTAVAPNYKVMIISRLVAGLPHGAYFGVAAIVADKLVDKAYSVMAVSIVIAGATVANMAGVPFSTLLNNLFSWRLAYIAVASVGLLVILGIALFVPSLPGLKHKKFSEQFAFLKSPIPWVIFFAIVFANGGMFSWYSYISPFMRDIAGINPIHMTLVMALAGTGMVIGNSISGRISMSFKPVSIASSMQIIMALGLLLICFWGSSAPVALAAMFICSACLFGVSAPQQILLLENAKGGEMLGVAMAQVGFNIGNAIGAWCGGIAQKTSYGLPSTAFIGALGALIGFSFLVLYAKKYGRKEDAKSVSCI